MGDAPETVYFYYIQLSLRQIPLVVEDTRPTTYIHACIARLASSTGINNATTIRLYNDRHSRQI